MFYRIEAPHFIAGLTVHEGVVSAAAPVIKYMVGWKIEEVVAYCKKHEWRIENEDFRPLA